MGGLLKSKKNPRGAVKKILILLACIGVITIITAVSYAYIVFYGKQKDINVIKSNCLKIEYLDLTDAINLTDAYPVSDEIGANTIPYRFSIKNVCNTGADYQVNLEVLDIENRMPSNNIATKIDEEEKQILTSDRKTEKLETTEYVAVEAYKLYTGTLNPGEAKEHSVRLWLDESATNESQNKEFQSKVVINATQNEIVVHEDLIHLVNAIEIAPKEIDEILATSEDINKIVTSKDAMEIIINSDYLKEEIKSSENYTNEIKMQILNATVISEKEKYNAGFPFYLFKNGKQGFTCSKDPNSNKFWAGSLTSSEFVEGTATIGSTLYIADTTKDYYSGGRLYSENLNLENYQNLTFSYSFANTSNDYCLANGLTAVVGINTNRSTNIHHNCSTTMKGTKTINISTYDSGYVQIWATARGYFQSTMSFSVSTIYLY